MQESTGGLLLINKPAGWTSFDVIAKLRGITGIKKIGHTGTLDPFATGLLVCAVERSATKHIDSLMGLPKTYEATIVLGATTETLDTESPVIPAPSVPTCSESDIDAAIASMLGDQLQTPPMFSAIKQNGKKLYELARAGKTVDREPRPITISAFERTAPIRTNGTHIELDARITVSSGTYIRVVAQDLAAKLATTGYLTTLRRTAVGSYTIDHAHTLTSITRENWRSLLVMLL